MSKVESSPVRPRIVAVVAIGLVLLIGLALVWLWPAKPDVEAISNRAVNEFMARQYDRAEADLATVLKFRQPTPVDSMLQAELLLVKGKTDEAMEALKRVPDEHPMAAQARLQAGQIELRRSRFTRAEAEFLEALKLDRRMERAYRELIYIYGMQLRRRELNATFRTLSELAPLTYSEAFLWSLSRGVTWEAAEIVQTLTRCLAADPDDRWARLGLAEGLRELARFDDADAALKPLPDSDPIARATRVRIALDRGDAATADALLEDGPKDDVDLALLRGRFALARGDGGEAVRQFQIAYKLAPTLREAVLGLSQALKNTGDLAAAAPLADEASKHERLGALIQKAAVEKNRDDPVLMKDLGAACADLGRLDEARAWYNLAVTHDPLDTQAQAGVARVKDLMAKKKP